MSRTIMVMMALILGLALIGTSCQAGVSTEAAADFYKGSTVKVICGEKPGGGTDLNGRTMALYMAEQLDATFGVENKTGAAHLEGMAYVWHATPDGLTIGCEDFASLITNDLHDVEGYVMEADKINFIGAVADESTIFWINIDDPINSIEDLKAGKDLKFVATSPAGMRAINLMMVAYLLDLDAVTITGFKGSADCNLAIMQGEATGTTSSAGSYQRGVQAGTHKGLFAIDVRRSGGAPELPAITELMEIPKEKLELLELMVTFRPSKTLYVQPGIAKDRLAFLRESFDEIAKRDDFRTDIEKLWYPGVPTLDGEELMARAEAAMKKKKLWIESFEYLFETYRR